MVQSGHGVLNSPPQAPPRRWTFRISIRPLDIIAALSISHNGPPPRLCHITLKYPESLSCPSPLLATAPHGINQCDIHIHVPAPAHACQELSYIRPVPAPPPTARNSQTQPSQQASPQIPDEGSQNLQPTQPSKQTKGRRLPLPRLPPPSTPAPPGH